MQEHFQTLLTNNLAYAKPLGQQVDLELQVERAATKRAYCEQSHTPTGIPTPCLHVSFHVEPAVHAK
jgi:hypothetical protein